MRRYHITLGSSTTAGGKVIAASSLGSINGARIALEGDAVACPSCKSIGKITCIGPRISETWNGKQVALENDLCICGCASPPKLKPSQSVRCQMLNAAVSGIETETRKNMATAENEDHCFDLAFEVKEHASGQLLPDYLYEIVLPDGTTVEGWTDKNGLTKKIAARYAAEATLVVFAPEPAPINPSWDR